MWPYLLAFVVICVPTIIILRRKIRECDNQRFLDQMTPTATTEPPLVPAELTQPVPEKETARQSADERRRQAELKLIATMESAFDQLITLYPEGSRDNRWRDYKGCLAHYAGLIRKNEPLF